MKDKNDVTSNIGLLRSLVCLVSVVCVWGGGVGQLQSGESGARTVKLPLFLGYRLPTPSHLDQSLKLVPTQTRTQLSRL